MRRKPGGPGGGSYPRRYWCFSSPTMRVAAALQAADLAHRERGAAGQLGVAGEHGGAAWWPRAGRSRPENRCELRVVERRDDARPRRSARRGPASARSPRRPAAGSRCRRRRSGRPPRAGPRRGWPGRWRRCPARRAARWTPKGSISAIAVSITLRRSRVKATTPQYLWSKAASAASSSGSRAARICTRPCACSALFSSPVMLPLASRRSSSRAEAARPCEKCSIFCGRPSSKIRISSRRRSVTGRPRLSTAVAERMTRSVPLGEARQLGRGPASRSESDQEERGHGARERRPSTPHYRSCRHGPSSRRVTCITAV